LSAASALQAAGRDPEDRDAGAEERHARGRAERVASRLSRRSCDGARATCSTVSTVATLALRSIAGGRGRRCKVFMKIVLQCHPSCRHRSMTVGRMQITLGEHGAWAAWNSSRLLLVGLRRPATDFEQVCGRGSSRAADLSRCQWCGTCLRYRRWALWL